MATTLTLQIEGERRIAVALLNFLEKKPLSLHLISWMTLLVPSGTRARSQRPKLFDCSPVVGGSWAVRPKLISNLQCPSSSAQKCSNLHNHNVHAPYSTRPNGDVHSADRQDVELHYLRYRFASARTVSDPNFQSPGYFNCSLWDVGQHVKNTT